MPYLFCYRPGCRKIQRFAGRKNDSLVNANRMVAMRRGWFRAKRPPEQGATVRRHSYEGYLRLQKRQRGFTWRIAPLIEFAANQARNQTPASGLQGDLRVVRQAPFVTFR
jgi:hypothetical protein